MLFVPLGFTLKPGMGMDGEGKLQYRVREIRYLLYTDQGNTLTPYLAKLVLIISMRIRNIMSGVSSDNKVVLVLRRICNGDHVK